ncbi:MAG: aerial mycelium formation protein [Actinobacteria bacterium]|nr:aerial mycelium formation protein [Actinomycetota bacterium]
MAQQRRLDRVLESGYLDGLDARSVEALREMRQECGEVETEVSYVRRLAHARIEILEAETERRANGGSLGDLIEALPRILADSGERTAPARTRLPGPLAPSMSIEWNRGLERLISDATLANLPSISDAELASTIEQLRDLDREVSATRKSVHAVIDAVDRALAARLAVGSS